MSLCKKCGAELLEGACFCMKCGSKVENEVICSKCGIKLPQGALYCYKCGTSVGSEQPKVDAIEAVRTPLYNASKMNTYPVAHVSNIGNMVYVEGKGLYFLDNFSGDFTRLMFLPCGQKKPKVIVRKQDGVGIYGLGYYHGEIFFWRDYFGKRGDCLDAISIETDETREVLRSESEKHFDGYIKSQPSVYTNGRYYYETQIDKSTNHTILRCYDIEKGVFVDESLPDLRSKKMPEDWFAPGGYVNREKQDEWSYGEKSYGTDLFFAVRGDYGFASLCGGAACTIRFLLCNPTDFIFFPIDTCICASNNVGLLFQYENIIISGGYGLRNGMGMYRIEVDKNSIKRLMSNDEYNKFGREYEGSAWMQGSKVFFGNHLYDIKDDKFYKSPLNYNIKDKIQYVEDENGGAYLLSSYGDLYYMPKDWYMAKSPIYDDFKVVSQS